LVLPGHKIGPFGEAVLEPEREKGIDMTLKIPWNGSATRFGQIDGSHGQHEAVKMVFLHCTQVDLMKLMETFSTFSP